MKKTITLFLLLFMPLFVMMGQTTIKLDEATEDIEITSETQNPITIFGTSQGKVIKVKSGKHKITLQDVKIEVKGCPFEIKDGATVELILNGANRLESTGGYGAGGSAGLYVDQTAVLDIKAEDGEASLTAIGGGGAGIGGVYNGPCGTVTIHGGTIEAQGGGDAAGIGGGKTTDGGTILIKDGTVTATGGTGERPGGGAGIGGGYRGDGGTITIEGGTVTATGGNFGAGIGGGYEGAGGTITISGGRVTAIVDRSVPGIGGGWSGQAGTFSTGTDGKAIIFASSEYGAVIEDQSGKENWQGLIFQKNDGQVYGDSYTLTEALTIPAGKTLSIPAGTTFNAGSNLTNVGLIKVEHGGTIEGVEGVTGIKYELVDDMIELEEGEWVYTGEYHEPEVTIQGDYTPDTDYTVEYKENRDRGTAKVIIKPINEATSKLWSKENKSIEKTFEIKQGKAKDVPTPTIEEVLTYDSWKTFGWYQYCQDLLPEPWEWGNIDETPTVAKKEYEIVFVVDDWNLDWSEIEGYTQTEYNSFVKRKVAITVVPATPTPEIPTDLKATYGQTLADVLLPEGWAWNDPTTTPVGTAGDNSFSATFTPKDNVNYTTVKESLTVAVSKKALTIAWADATYEKGETITPASINGWIASADAEGSTVTYTDQDGQPVALADLPVGTHEITASATIVNPNYEAPTAVKATITIEEPYVPPTPVDPEPTPEPDPVYYTITIPETITGAIIEGSGTHTVREYNSITFRIEIDPNGTGQYPTVTRGDQWWNTLTPDSNGTYRVYAYGDTEIRIGEVPGYTNYRLVLPTDSVFENDSTYWSAAGIEVSGMTALGNDIYEAPFGTSVTLSLLPDPHRTFLEWEDGTRQVPRTLLLRDDQEIRALYRKVSPVSVEAVDGLRAYTSGSTLYICTPQKTPALICTPAGRLIFSGEIEGTQRFYGLQPGVYIVQVGDRTFKLTV